MSKYVNRASIVEMLRQKEKEAEGFTGEHYAYGRAALLIETFNDPEADELEISCKNLGAVVGKYFL